MTARKNHLLLMAVLSAVALYHSVAVATTAGGSGDEVRDDGDVNPTAASGGCPDAFWNCNDWCHTNGYKNGGVCVPPLRKQSCCVGPRSA